ncbi:MAG: PfaD family polyunsaturated fatty acid/polyketide biosynthesis protein [Proteobacteria bacterium]|nr:PfaD family polyunsaturated fatty acid/polyketide biosynthesis protein [Pseudomonadota bacterium]
MNTLTNVMQCWWVPTGASRNGVTADLQHALLDLRRPLVIADRDGVAAVVRDGQIAFGEVRPGSDALPVLAFAPALPPEALGDASFCAQQGIRYAYIAGAMANGIASEALVIAMGRAGMLGVFGAAGLSLPRVEQAIDRIQAALGDLPYAFNLIHSPGEPGLDDRVVDLYLRRGVRRICASAFLDLTLAVVRYRFHGIHRDAAGAVVTPNHVYAKISRVELARKFFAPPPPDMLSALVSAGALTAAQAELAATLPVAQDITAEADSGGHTDNRPALALFPTIAAVRDEMQRKHGYAVPLRVGAAGGIGTPSAAAAAFAMGAAYVMTGSVNQACVEAGTSAAVREMLAQASQADVAMAPAADMFEMGVKVQVLKRGTMFSVRARKLYDLYRAHETLDALPASERAVLERDFFRCSLEQEWAQTRAFFETRDPRQIERAEREPRHKMALVFRSYLGRASGWANQGEASRRVDYQIWCGPAMGAFNEWARGSLFDDLSARTVETVALNIMIGAAVLTRAATIRAQGASLPPEAQQFPPMPIDRIRALLRPQSTTV